MITILLAWLCASIVAAFAVGPVLRRWGRLPAKPIPKAMVVIFLISVAFCYVLLNGYVFMIHEAVLADEYGVSGPPR